MFIIELKKKVLKMLWIHILEMWISRPKLVQNTSAIFFNNDQKILENNIIFLNIFLKYFKAVLYAGKIL